MRNGSQLRQFETESDPHRGILEGSKYRSIFAATKGVSLPGICRVKRSLNNDLDLIPPLALQAGGAAGSIPVTSTTHLKLNRLRKPFFAIWAILEIWEQ